MQRELYRLEVAAPVGGSCPLFPYQRGPRLDDLPVVLAELACFVLRKYLFQSGPDQLFPRHADEIRQKAVGEADPPFLGDAVDRDRRVVQETHQELLGLAQGLLGLLALGNVAVVDDDAAHARLVEQVGAGYLQVPPRTVAMAPPYLGRECASRRFQELGEHSPCHRDVVGVHQGEGAGADPLLGSVTQHPFDRRGHVGDGAVGVDHGDDVRRVADERAEPLLALP